MLYIYFVGFLKKAPVEKRCKKRSENLFDKIRDRMSRVGFGNIRPQRDGNKDMPSLGGCSRYNKNWRFCGGLVTDLMFLFKQEKYKGWCDQCN